MEFPWKWNCNWDYIRVWQRIYIQGVQKGWDQTWTMCCWGQIDERKVHINLCPRMLYWKDIWRSKIYGQNSLYRIVYVWQITIIIIIIIITYCPRSPHLTPLDFYLWSHVKKLHTYTHARARYYICSYKYIDMCRSKQLEIRNYMQLFMYMCYVHTSNETICNYDTICESNTR